MGRNTAAEWITALNMKKHPEGGYFREVLKSDKSCVNQEGAERAQYTSIYFLLPKEQVSNFHRLKADEIWYFHDGSPLTIHMIDPQGNYTSKKLGLNIDEGESAQLLVPEGTIFGASSDMDDDRDYSLVGCMVSPGFEFEDFILYDRKDLLAIYPQCEAVIRQLTNG
ncbi:cupin domain-containing protein [Salisediminibacterium beveridgei]|uniref:DUF985 domain-containing protein n=1 Tax=Salisediminibacterium beveridgei TaxID=632773 RepID=A0A1D7QXQ2_9BACI|nr:cupin domain-containing protein [Salisediminibacterium beveridgei]AOM83785.1 conserved hypothetical protein, Cupin superfamily [Salisediminibacterium beveridgei]